MTTPTERLRDLGIELPPVAKPRWSYVPAVRTGNLLFISGQIATEAGRILHPGKVGAGVTVEQAAEAARGCAVLALAVAAAEVGSVDQIARAVKSTVFVASAPGFGEQPTVANGASDLLREVLGADGIGARAAIGVAELPLGASVEAEFVFELKEEG
jgi:enamine deaminase RidA (YjgF/YER057c/UK114 family)